MKEIRNMLHYKKVNLNPKGRRTGDCSTRALANILRISYEEALRLQCEMSIKRCYGLTNKETIDWILKDYGYIKMKQPKRLDNTKYQVREMDNVLTTEELKNGVIILVANHWTIVRDDSIEDIWNCGEKCVGNYWIKG